MKRALIICIVALSFPLIGNNTAPIQTPSDETFVYICTGPQAEKFHKSPQCRGLKNCSCEIVKVKRSQAVKKGRKECKLCYNKKQNNNTSIGYQGSQAANK